ncbi:unnamed protein product [Dovyalis caffra]|uniref:Uncharacterized protein n=1 Tax=Dovyalis caffra TaxID=77055 RepID=A0AAV1S595_9ROSI|nr:unnamed protein product [Dovyalis caffra]
MQEAERVKDKFLQDYLSCLASSSLSVSFLVRRKIIGNPVYLHRIPNITDCK